MIKAAIQATRVLYRTENAPYFQLPDSFTIAVIDAIHGQYSNTNTIKLNAEAIENSLVPSTTQSVDTTISLAGIPATIATVARQ